MQSKKWKSVEIEKEDGIDKLRCKNGKRKE